MVTFFVYVISILIKTHLKSLARMLVHKAEGVDA